MLGGESRPSRPEYIFAHSQPSLVQYIPALSFTDMIEPSTFLKVNDERRMPLALKPRNRFLRRLLVYGTATVFVFRAKTDLLHCRHISVVYHNC